MAWTAGSPGESSPKELAGDCNRLQPPKRKSRAYTVSESSEKPQLSNLAILAEKPNNNLSQKNISQTESFPEPNRKK
jgi:hypothetical protein